MTWRRFAELDVAHPDLADVFRQAVENGVELVEAFDNLGDSVIEACSDYLRGVEQALEAGYLEEPEAKRLTARFREKMRHE